MSLSIFDIQKLKQSDVEKGIVEMFIRESDLMKVIPFTPVDTMSVQTRRMNSLPNVSWRQRGQRFAQTGQPGFDMVTDALYNIGAEINLDDADIRDKGPYIENPVQFNTEAITKSIVYDLHDKVINGDHATDGNSPEGLKVRIAALGTGQNLYTASEVDVRPSAVTSTTAYTWLNRIEEAKYACDGHTADVCLTDGDFIRSLKNALRVLGVYVNSPGTPTSGINERRTSNDVPAMSGKAFVWDGVAYIDMGVKADQTTKIVATETITNACRPAFFVKLGAPYFHFIQNGSLEVGKLEQLEDKVTWRKVISWYLGFRHVHNRFGVKLSGSRVA